LTEASTREAAGSASSIQIVPDAVVKAEKVGVKPDRVY